MFHFTNGHDLNSFSHEGIRIATIQKHRLLFMFKIPEGVSHLVTFKWTYFNTVLGFLLKKFIALKKHQYRVDLAKKKKKSRDNIRLLLLAPASSR